MICKLENDARPALNLQGPGLRALATNHNTLLVQHGVETIKRLYPALDVRVTDSARADRGWLEPTGSSVINLRHARPDSPFHETGHLWEAVLNDQLPPAEYDGYLEELTGTPQLDGVRQRYPDKADRIQRREALVQLLGENSAALVLRGASPDKQSGLQTLIRTLYQRLRNALIPLLGPPAVLELPLAMRSLRSVLNQGVQALTTTPSPVLASTYAKRLITETLQQRVGAARNPGELLELLTGRDPVFSDDEVQSHAAEALAEAKRDIAANSNQLRFRVKGGQRGSYTFPAGLSTDDERRDFIADKIREAQQAQRQQLGEDAVGFFAASADEQARLVVGKYATQAEEVDKGPMDDKKREQRQLYYQEIQRLLPDYEVGDTVQHYADGGSDFYDAAVDGGGIILHQAKRKDPVSGEEKTIVSLAALTDGPLGETRKDRSFLAGLYDGSGLKGFFREQAVRYGFEVKLPATHENRLKMQLLLTAMHLRSKGYQVNSMAIGKLNTERSGENQAITFWPTEHLQALQQIASILPVQEALQASGEPGAHLLSLLQNKDLYNASDYALDPLRHLSDHYRAATPPARLIRTALGEYYAAKSATSMVSLEKSIRRRLKELIRSSVGDRYKTDKEFLMLSDAQVQLKGVSYYLNPWHVMDRVSQLYTSFLRHTNPLMQYFINEWDNKWYQVSQQFQGMQDEHRVQTEKLHEWYRSRHAGVGAAERVFEQTQGRYYDDLWVKQDVDYYNAASDSYEQKNINTFRLALPGSEQFTKLAAPQQAYITWALGTIRDRVSAVERQKRTADGKTFTQKDIDKWYEENWGDGRVPVVQASVWQSVLKGDVAYATEQQLRSLLEDNPRFHDQQADQEDYLSEYIMTQSNDDHRRKLLGLERTADGKADKLRSQGGLETHNRMETDLRRVMNIVMMQTLKHELTAELETDLRVGQALLRHHETAQGLARHQGQVDSTTTEGAAGGTQNEKAFLEMARMLWLNRTNQGKGSGLEKRLSQLMSAAGSLTTSSILLGNIMVPIQTGLTTVLGNLVPQALAAQGFEATSSSPSISYVKDAVNIVSTPANWPKLEAIARQLGVSRHGEFDLLSQRKSTGEPLRLFSTDTMYSLDRWADDATRITIMVAMLKQQGIYENYAFDEDTRKVSYDVDRDRKVRGDKTVDAVRDALEVEGVLQPGQQLDRAYDGTLRRTMEAVIGDVMAGYSPLTQTTLGATALGNQVRKLAGFMPMRIERALMPRQKTPGKGRRDNEGNIVHEEEVGQLRSLLKRLSQGTIEAMGLVSKETRGERLTQADQLNLRNLTSNFALYLAFTAAAVAAGKALEADKDKKRGIALKLLDALIMETFAFENFRMVLGKGANPFITMTMLKNMADGMSNVVLPGKDAAQGWHQVTSRIGAKRSIDNALSLLDDE